MLKRKSGIIVFVFCLLTLTIFSIRIFVKKEVTIVDESRTITVASLYGTAEEVLSFAGISLRQEDNVSIPLTDKVENGQVIKIDRAKPVIIVDKDKEMEFFSTSNSVRTILSEAGLSISEDDKVYPSISSNLTADRSIEIIRVEVEYVTENVTIPQKSVIKRTTDLSPGDTRIDQSGKDGLKEVTYKIVSENNQEVSKSVVSETVIEDQVSEIVSVGSDKLFITSRGMPFRYSSSFIVEATAYDLSFASCGKYPDHPEYGITYTGSRARPGVIAVDPRVIPLGSKLYVQSLDYTDDYGFSSAEDTGSAIKGYKIDLFIESNYEALRYGRRNVRVYILDEAIDNSLIKGYSN